MSRAEWNAAWVGMWAELGNVVQHALIGSVVAFMAIYSDDFIEQLHRKSPMLAAWAAHERERWIRLRELRDAGRVASS